MKRTTLFLLVAIAGCATTPPINTPSGRPEVTIADVTKKQVSDALINRELSNGMDVKSQSDTLLVFSKRLTGVMAQMLFGSQLNTVPEERLTFTVVDSVGGVRVLGRVEIVTNPGTGLESITDGTGQLGAKVQAALEEVRNSLAKK